MARNIYPLFERHRIMKKELLWALRDYSYGFMRRQYGDYTDGILTGLALRVEGNQIEIGAGLVKFQDSVILFERPEYVTYEPMERYVCLKLKLHLDDTSEDYIAHSVEPFLSENMTCAGDEIEVCHFKLKSGSRLRTQYVEFYDIATEYDTVNLVDATWSGMGQASLCPAITRRFAEEALRSEWVDARDMAFCHAALNISTALHRLTIVSYVRAKLELEETAFSNWQLFEHLALILRNLQDGTELRPPRQVKKSGRLSWIEPEK